MTCDTFVARQSQSINQILQPVTGVIISSTAVLSNYFKRHFQGTKDVKYFKSLLYESKFIQQCNIFKSLCFLIITYWIALIIFLQSWWLLMYTYLSLSLPLWPEVFLFFPLPLLPFSASCIYFVNTNFKFPSLLSILPAVLWYLCVIFSIWAGL